LTIILFILFTISTTLAAFDCPQLPQAPPAKSARTLHPSNVKMIGALGDSITAAFAMHNGVLEYRHDTFSIGANSSATTIVNYLKHYNPTLMGGAAKNVVPLDVTYKNKTVYLMEYNNATRLNAGISEAKAEDLFEQIDYLEWAMRHKYPTDVFEKGFKVITIFIGANNLCISCEGNRPKSTPDGWADTMNQLVTQIYQRIPRVFLNLVSLPRIGQLYNLWQTSSYCKLFHIGVDECPCLGHKGETGRTNMDKNSALYNQKLAALAQTWQEKMISEKNDDFWVVYQPQNEDVVVSTLALLSNLDCFHPSALANELMAKALWNNMLTPQSKKLTNTTLEEVAKCATIDSILQ